HEHELDGGGQPQAGGRQLDRPQPLVLAGRRAGQRHRGVAVAVPMPVAVAVAAAHRSLQPEAPGPGRAAGPWRQPGGIGGTRARLPEAAHPRAGGATVVKGKPRRPWMPAPRWRKMGSRANAGPGPDAAVSGWKLDPSAR